MNNLLRTKKRVQKAERLRRAQIVTFKKGVFTSYSPSIFEERLQQAHEDLSTQ